MVGGSRDSLTGECSGHVLVPIYVLSRDGHSTSGSQDILTGRMGGAVESSVHVPIHVLSVDGHSISGFWDTLDRKT